MTSTKHLFAPRPKILLIQGIVSRLILGNNLFNYSELLHFFLVVEALVKSEGTACPFHNKLNSNVLWKAIGRDCVGFRRAGFTHIHSQIFYTFVGKLSY